MYKYVKRLQLVQCCFINTEKNVAIKNLAGVKIETDNDDKYLKVTVDIT